MHERVSYRNHLGQELIFGQQELFANESDLHDYSWGILTRNNRISGFKRTVTTRKLPVVIMSRTPEDGLRARNRLLEIADVDVLAGIPGRLIVGEFYLPCYITASAKKSYTITEEHIQVELTVTTDSKFWIREDRYSFSPAADEGTGVDYPRNDPFDYTTGYASRDVFNRSIAPANFRLIVYGAASSPTVQIGEHIYSVATTLAVGEYLTIDSTAKTVVVTGVDGSTRNAYAERDREHYIFQRIEPGASSVSWEGGFEVELVLLDERSEPEWI